MGILGDLFNGIWNEIKRGAEESSRLSEAERWERNKRDMLTGLRHMTEGAMKIAESQKNERDN